jgi:cytochrome c2
MRFFNARSAVAILLCVSAVLLACEADKSHWTDAQLRLTSEQAAGRRVFNNYCAVCHSAYTSKKLTGPSLKDLYKKRAMPSGAPPTDERVSAVVMRGRQMMPAFRAVLDDNDLQALLAYLHTL